MRREEPKNRFHFRDFRYDENGTNKEAQRVLADRLNLPRSRIAALETKENVNPTAEEIRAYCEAFNTTADYLLFGIGVKTKNVYSPENVDIACRVTGLSHKSVKMLREWRFDGKKSLEDKNVNPALSNSELKALNKILEYTYDLGKKYHDNGGQKLGFCIFHFIWRYWNSDHFVFKPLDRLRAFSGHRWHNIDIGSQLALNGEEMTVEKVSATYSNGHPGSKDKRICVHRDTDDNEFYDLEISGLIRADAQNKIMKALDEIGNA